VDPDHLRKLLDEVRAGKVPVDEAMTALRELPFRSLGFAHADTHRHLRTGFPEVVLGAGKTAQQIATLLEALGRDGVPVMATRVTAAVATDVLAAVPAARYLEVPRIVVLGQPAARRGRGTVAVLTAGTSDIPVAEEAAVTAEMDGNEVVRIFDVGVAGLHRLLAHRATIEAASVLVVAAGMDGVLPTVTAGIQGCCRQTPASCRTNSSSLGRQPPGTPLRSGGSPTAVSIMMPSNSALPGTWRYSDILVKPRSPATRCIETASMPSVSAT